MRAGAVVVGFNHWYGDSLADKAFTRDFVTALKEKNPGLNIVLIDNASEHPYPVDIVEVIRLDERVGYGKALNIGLERLQKEKCDWYVCFNNDCAVQGDGNILRILETLDTRTLYGSGENYDKKKKIMWQWSAWLVISREVLQTVGVFDEHLEAAFEDFDYELRALGKGYKLDTAKFPILHLDEHTRFEDSSYPHRWEKARNYFNVKHGMEMERWFVVK